MLSEERERLMNLSLEEKIERSKMVIQDALKRFGAERMAIAWTGGKDSTTLTWLFREVCRDTGMRMPVCMFIDEGDVFEEIWEFVNRLKDEWKLDVRIAKNLDVCSKAKRLGDMIRVTDLNEINRREIEKIGFKGDEFPFEPESFVGNHLMKTVAMKLFLEENAIDALATAIRWDEQSARGGEDYFSPREDPPHTRVQPILHFKERDIWDNIHRNKIPFCELYRYGYRSLGAKSTTHKTSDIPAWEQDLENTVERAGRGQDKEEVMDRLRSLGYM